MHLDCTNMYTLFRPKFYTIPFGPLRGTKLFLSPTFGFSRIWGVYNSKIAKYLAYYIEKGSEVLVVSSDYGYISLICAKLVGNRGKVTTIDITPQSREYLTKTLLTTSNTHIKLVDNYVFPKKTKTVIFAFSDSSRPVFEKLLEDLMKFSVHMVVKILSTKDYTHVHKKLTAVGYTLYDLDKRLLTPKSFGEKRIYIVARKI